MHTSIEFHWDPSILYNSPLKKHNTFKGENITSSCYITMKLPTAWTYHLGRGIGARPKEIINFILLILEFMLSLLGYCIVFETVEHSRRVCSCFLKLC